MSNIIRNRAATTSAAKASDQAAQRTPPALLAQIPDLDATHSPVRLENPGDGRILNQALSVRLILGGGAVLVMLALMASFWHRATRPAVVTELPPWHGAAGTNSPVTASTNVPVVTAGIPAPTTKAIAEAKRKDSATRTAFLQPQTPAAVVSRPGSNHPAWQNGALTPPVTAVPAPSQVARPADSNPVERGNYRNYDHPSAGVYQADTRNDASGGYRTAGGYDVQGRDGATRNADGPANGLPNNYIDRGRRDVNPVTGAQYLPPVNAPSRTEFAPPISYPQAAGTYSAPGTPQPQPNYPPAGGYPQPQNNYPQNGYPTNSYPQNNTPANNGGYPSAQGGQYGAPYGPNNNAQYGPNNGQGNSAADPGTANFNGSINTLPQNYTR